MISSKMCLQRVYAMGRITSLRGEIETTEKEPPPPKKDRSENTLSEKKPKLHHLRLRLC